MMLKGELARLFSEEALQRAELIYEMVRKDSPSPAVYKDQIIEVLCQFGEYEKVKIIEEWFKSPEFGKTASNWRRLLRLDLKSETLKKEIKNLYDTIINDLFTGRFLSFFKIPVRFNSNKLDTYEFLRFYNKNSCIRNRKFKLKNVYPVLVASEKENRIIGRALTYESTINARIIFNVYIQHDAAYAGFHALSEKYSHSSMGGIVIKECRHKSWVGDFYVDDFIIITEDETVELDEVLEEFFNELKEFVINDEIGECSNCGEIIREDDEYITTIEGDIYCRNCCDELTYCDSCRGYHDTRRVEMVRVRLDFGNYYYTCDFSLLG